MLTCIRLKVIRYVSKAYESIIHLKQTPFGATQRKQGLETTGGTSYASYRILGRENTCKQWLSIEEAAQVSVVCKTSTCGNLLARHQTSNLLYLCKDCSSRVRRSHVEIILFVLACYAGRQKQICSYSIFQAILGL